MKPPVYDEAWDAELVALWRHDMEEMWDPKRAIHMRNRYHNQLDIYLALAPAPISGGPRLDIMDVGCAQATLAMLLAERGHKVLAVDLREKFLEYARSRYTHGDIEFRVGNALEMDVGRKFDLIYANQIIEHIVYPDQLVFGLKALLRPGGRLVVTTPSWHYLVNDLPSFSEIGDPQQYEDKQFTADSDGHFFSYREEELLEIMKRQGLTYVQTRLFETPIISGHLKMRYLHKVVPEKALRTLDRALLSTPARRWVAHQLMVVGVNP